MRPVRHARAPLPSSLKCTGYSCSRLLVILLMQATVASHTADTDGGKCLDAAVRLGGIGCVSTRGTDPKDTNATRIDLSLQGREEAHGSLVIFDPLVGDLPDHAEGRCFPLDNQRQKSGRRNQR